MRNRIVTALGRHKKEAASGISVAVIGVAAVATLGAGTAAAHGMVDSGRIQNQTVSQADVEFAGVSGSVGTGNSEIQGQSVGAWNIGQSQVKSYQIRDGSVHPKDLSKESKEGFTGPRGPEGPKGEKGEKGEPGEDGVSGYEVVGVEERFTAGKHELTAQCPSGKVAIGGGFQASADGAGGSNTDVFAADLSDVTDPEGDGTWQATSYTVQFDNSAATGSPSGQGNMRVRVICAAVN